MTYHVDCHLGGDIVGRHHTAPGAIIVAAEHAKRTGQRHNVHTATGRLVSIWPHAVLWQTELDGLTGSELTRRYQEAERAVAPGKWKWDRR